MDSRQFQQTLCKARNANGRRERNTHDPKAVELKDTQFNLKIECVTADSQ